MLFPVVINVSSWESSYFPPVGKGSSLCLLHPGRDADPALEGAKANPNQREAETLYVLGKCWQGAGAGLAERGHSSDNVTNEAIWTLLAVLSCCVSLAVLQWKEREWWKLKRGAA